MTANRKKLGELLITAGLIDELQLRSALSYQKEWGGRLGAVLIRKGFVKETAMISAIGNQLGMQCISLEEFEKPSEEVMSILKEDIARKFGILPQQFDGKTLLVATSDPTDLKTVGDLEFLLNVRIKPFLALESDIHTAIDHFYNPVTSSTALKRREYVLEVSDIPFSPSGENYELIQNDVIPEELDNNIHEFSPGDTEQSLFASIVDLLVEKGIFTREELAEKLRLRKG